MEEFNYQQSSGQIVSRPIAFEHTIYLDGPLDEPSNYRQVMDTIRYAQEGSVVTLRLNGPGGRADIAGAIIKAMMESQAHIVTSIEHSIASAHTLIFLAGHEYVVPDLAEMMCHSASSGYFGKEAEIYSWAEHFNRSTKKTLEAHYEGFFSKEEIQSILDGRDFWLDSDEIIRRLEQRGEYFKNLHAKDLIDCQHPQQDCVAADITTPTIQLKLEPRECVFLDNSEVYIYSGRIEVVGYTDDNETAKVYNRPKDITRPLLVKIYEQVCDKKAGKMNKKFLWDCIMEEFKSRQSPDF